jgi:SAM-dependent methyltransferase
MVVAGTDLFARHLARVPAFRALIRCLEGRLYSEYGLARPVLDIGCGDGHFSAVAFPGGLDVGLDIQPACAFEARRNGTYRLLAVASGTALPFANGRFLTVLSNCAIEHEPDVGTLLGEVSRVLSDGGRFLFTVPNERFTESLYTVATLRAVGLHRWAERYGRWWNRRAAHHHLDSSEVWHRRLELAGMTVEFESNYLSPAATRAFELSHYYAASSFVWRRIVRHRPAGLANVQASFAYRWLRRHAEEPPSSDGSGTFFVARKGSAAPDRRLSADDWRRRGRQ